MTNGIDKIIAVLFGLLCLCLLALLLAAAVKKFVYFYDELQKINIEIARTTGAERLFWRREKRRVWRLLIPFYRE